ncbi:hypothetical protein [Sphaerisporangium corydalis]|uniref:Uncharacterized protein n=1 Tax=Sphaerisporangium corydalis TaxID=1441875 RepID=A0ABV9EM75_9ACTN|nr:hypothetical protein [Sphaerisporangium corydalis]
MPAAYAAARSTETAAHVVRDDEASLARRRAARAALDSALPIVPADELAMAPTSYVPALGCGGVLFGVVTVGALTIYQLATEHRSGDSVLLAVGAAAGLLSVFFILLLLPARARRQKIEAGRPAAEAIWRRGWYCYRCAIVYFQAGEQPAGIAPGQPLTPAQFKHIVWTAGRYGRST